jgi:hypothetical protein
MLRSFKGLNQLIAQNQLIAKNQLMTRHGHQDQAADVPKCYQTDKKFGFTGMEKPKWPPQTFTGPGSREICAPVSGEASLCGAGSCETSLYGPGSTQTSLYSLDSSATSLYEPESREIAQSSLAGSDDSPYTSSDLRSCNMEPRSTERPSSMSRNEGPKSESLDEEEAEQGRDPLGPQLILSSKGQVNDDVVYSPPNLERDETDLKDDLWCLTQSKLIHCSASFYSLSRTVAADLGCITVKMATQERVGDLDVGATAGDCNAGSVVGDLNARAPANGCNARREVRDCNDEMPAEDADTCSAAGDFNAGTAAAYIRRLDALTLFLNFFGIPFIGLTIFIRYDYAAVKKNLFEYFRNHAYRLTQIFMEQY